MRYAMRAVEKESLRALEARIFDCFRAGGLATGCECRIDEGGPAYDELRPDPWLANAFRDEMNRRGRTPVPAGLETALPLGSTDMGNVTHAMPTLVKISPAMEFTHSQREAPRATSSTAGMTSRQSHKPLRHTITNSKSRK